MEIRLSSPDDLPAQMPALAEAIGSRRKIALYGELGAGKTTLVNAFCRYLGVHEPTSSPTFALINQYAYTRPDGTAGLVYHLDLYRLRSLAEAQDIGIDDLLDDPWFCFIEWPQVIEPLLPADTVKIQLEILDKTQRRLLIL